MKNILKLIFYFLVTCDFVVCDLVAKNFNNLVLHMNCKDVADLGYNDCNLKTDGESLVARKFIESDDLVFDVGANSGDWSAQVFVGTPNVRICAFEPIPDLIPALNKKLEDYFIRIFNVAIFSRECAIDFFYYKDRSDLSSINLRPDLNKVLMCKPKKLNVETITLDNFCINQGMKHIDFLKIDTEGSEFAVLTGAKQLIGTTAIDFIQFGYGESYKDSKATLKHIYQFLTQNRYAIFRIFSKGLIYIPAWDDSLENFKASNYLAISYPQLIAMSGFKDALKSVKPFIPENPIILEAGAYDGKDSVNMAKFWPAGFVHAFEPIPENYDKLILKTKDFANIRTYDTALGTMAGSLDFHVSSFDKDPQIPGLSSSALAPKEHLVFHPNIKFDKTIKVPVTTIDLWAEANGIDHVDFMWLDLQGYELEVLKASPNIMRDTKAIFIELEFSELYKDQYLFQDVKNWLEVIGFKMIAFNFSCPWAGDGIFVRKIRGIVDE